MIYMSFSKNDFYNLTFAAYSISCDHIKDMPALPKFFDDHNVTRKNSDAPKPGSF